MTKGIKATQMLVKVSRPKRLKTYIKFNFVEKQEIGRVLSSNENFLYKIKQYVFLALYRLYNYCIGVNMNSCSKIVRLQALSSDLLNNAFTEIRSHRKKTSPPNEEYFFTAEYLLQEAMEYVSGAWEMIKSGKFNASIALSRWILEASLNLLWTVSDKDKIEERHKILIGEALRNDAYLYEGYAKIWPNKRHQCEATAKETREIRKNLGVEKPKDLNNRLESIRQSQEKKWPDLYPFYRICCAAAHPNLKVWERFGIAKDSIVPKDPIGPVDKQSIACWMATAPILYLVASTYRLTELGDSKKLKDWWENKVQPLLITIHEKPAEADPS